MTDATNQYDEFVKGLGNRKKRELKNNTDSIHNVFIDSLDRFEFQSVILLPGLTFCSLPRSSST